MLGLARPSPLFMISSMPMRHFGKARGLRENRVKKMYNCVPEWSKTVAADPFDYKLRSLAEVREHQKYFPPDFVINMEQNQYPGDDQRFTENNSDHRPAIARITVDMRQMKLAPLQRERFIFLLGPRYNPKKPFDVRIVMRQYSEYQQNFDRACEVLREMYWEALRAPDDLVNFRRNPYLRENTIKRVFGKDAATRNGNIKERKNQLKALMGDKDREVAEAEILGMEEAK